MRVVKAVTRDCSGYTVDPDLPAVGRAARGLEQVRRVRDGRQVVKWSCTYCMKSSECRRDVDCQPPAISVLRSASALELLELNIDPTRMNVVVLSICDLKISILKRLSALFVLTGDVKMTAEPNPRCIR